jgi:hypothetical protein
MPFTWKRQKVFVVLRCMQKTPKTQAKEMFSNDCIYEFTLQKKSSISEAILPAWNFRRKNP